MTDAPFGPGTVLAGRFVLEDLLHESAGAGFWRATDRVLARSVAVHVLSDDDPRAASLLDGARSSALVSDVHLLRVLDAAAADGVVYVVNEWGSGASLDRLLADGVLSPRRAAWVVKEVAEAITTAHRNGVAHGRLLPENVMISETGTVKLIGFVIDAVLRSPTGPRRVIDGEPVSAHQSDVLNLAGLLYAALVGRWPGTEGSTVPTAPVEHGRPLRPRRVRAGVPRPLDAICEQVLNAGAHPTAAPIETAHEIQAALRDFIGEPGGSSSWTPSGQEPTVLIDRADLLRSADGDAGLAGSDTRSDTGAGDRATAGTAQRAADPTEDTAAVERVDPEATQAGVPAFVDEGGGLGWTSPTRSGDPGASSDTLGQPAARRTRPAPPPPPPPAPERPLFADGRSSAASPVPAPATASALTSGTGSFAGSSRSSGPANGPVPPAWGPDADHPRAVDDPGWDTGGRDEHRPGRTWLRLAVILAVALAVVLTTVFVLGLGRGSQEQAAGSKASSAPRTKPPGGVRLPIAAVTDFDPQGNPPDENPELAPLAVDGSPSTAWHTVTYYDPLEKQKSGVGLRVDLGKPVTVGEVRLTLAGSPTALQILAAPGAGSAPTSTDGLRRVAADPTAGTSVDLRLKKTVRTRWLVVWLTSLPTAPGGYQGRIAEISVRS